MVTWLDVHTHFNMLKTSTPQKALQQALEAGVEKMITIGTGPQDFEEVLSIAKAHQPHVYATLGVHPHEAMSFDESVERYLNENLKAPEVVAVGEIGLDYYYKHSPIETQKKVFRRQLEISLKQDLPVEVHTRDAEEDTVSILEEFRGNIKGLVHCFTGTQFLADAVLDLGMNVSVSGVVTFKNAHKLRQVIRSLPMDRIHVETDAPFLAPVPMRGQENTPAYVVHTGRFVAGLLGVTEREFSETTYRNAFKLFPKLNKGEKWSD